VSNLELKVPPDVVWVLVAALMWLVSRYTPALGLHPAVRIGAAVVLTVAGVWLIVAARVLLDRAKTTWQPTAPRRATAVVDTGVYHLSRNPMYLGMLLVLAGWAVLLSSPAALAVSAVFVLYLDRFQIGPEERALSDVLGQDYPEYLKTVRRWI
jgi:protein-S-isoprenylcysteine O-methyltransferase Ste14